jgi:hypothetical protein
MKGEYRLKVIFCSLLCSVFLLNNIYIVLAQDMSGGLEPPSKEQAQTLWQNIKQGIKGAFEGIKRLGEGVNWFKPFFDNTGHKISSWWSIQAKPWVNNSWKDLNNYLNQRIIIN